MQDAAIPHSGSDSDELAALLEAEFAGDDLEQLLEGSPHRAEGATDTRPSAKRQKLNTEVGGQSCPPHPGFMGGICIRCGGLKGGEGEGAEEANVALRYIHRGLEISRSEAERMRAGTASRVLAGRKLLLMLDLDHTLLNSSRFGEVDAQGEAVLRTLMKHQSAEEPHIYCLPHMRMWTKLRPGVRRFLLEAHERFELHIYTMGDSEYAAEMSRLLDPQGRLFHGRVISSGDTTQRSVKDLDIVLGNENVVLILDDTEGVWPRHRGNLVQIERYTYFPADARRFGLGCQSLLERRMDEDGERGALQVSLQVMMQVHQRYFAEDPEGHSDVRRHLSSIRRAILEGVHILFSRIIPLDCVDPHAHPLWRLAQDLGAQCSTVLDDSVTHVVATDNTDKTRWAKKHGKRVVNPNWLWCSAFTWSHADEARFQVTAATSWAAQQALQRTPEDGLAAAMAAAGGGTGEFVRQQREGQAGRAGAGEGEGAAAPSAGRREGGQGQAPVRGGSQQGGAGLPTAAPAAAAPAGAVVPPATGGCASQDEGDGIAWAAVGSRGAHQPGGAAPSQREGGNSLGVAADTPADDEGAVRVDDEGAVRVEQGAGEDGDIEMEAAAG